MWVDFRASIDFVALLSRVVLLTVVVFIYPSKTIFLFGIIHLMSSMIQWMAYFWKLCHELKSTDSTMGSLNSLNQVLPNFNDIHFDQASRERKMNDNRAFHLSCRNFLP